FTKSKKLLIVIGVMNNFSVSVVSVGRLHNFNNWIFFYPTQHPNIAAGKKPAESHPDSYAYTGSNYREGLC
ncbi:hypothetical protein NLN91_22180, partial [Citrobacter portucalensis]|uniref:hypothetical protein n=1 Tax=Citrobacter portucalensis TaxID=1639133 RepID=UPI00226B64BC